MKKQPGEAALPGLYDKRNDQPAAYLCILISTFSVRLA